MSNSVSTPSTGKLSAEEPRLIQQRFSLRRRMAQTALADVYWANDLHGISPTVPESIVLLLTVAPALVGMPDFALGWNQVMNRPAPAADAYPDIIAHGEDRGIYWLACRDIKGTLLSEFIQGLSEQGLPTEQALDMAEALTQTANSIQAGAYGYLEPGAILRTDQGYKILNAPLVKIIHQLITRNNTGSRHPLSLHSSYLSPSVAVGDVPIQEDDTFSVACILHALFTGVPPYGSQSTLAAAARADQPAIANRFKPESQDILSNALALQRNQRPESPETLLQSIRRKSKRKVLFPLAVLAAAGVVTYASYHLLTKVDSLLSAPPATTQAVTPEAAPTPAAEQATQPVIIGAEHSTKPAEAKVELINEEPPVESTTPAAETAQNSEMDKPDTDTPDITEGAQVAPETAAPEPEAAAPVQATAPPEPSPADPVPQTESPPTAEPVRTASPDQQQEIRQLLAQAGDALAANQLENRNGQPGAMDLLRQAWALDRDNADTRALLNRMLQSKQQQTENLINRSLLAEAKKSMAESDEFMREFVLTDRIQEQIKLENRIAVREREQEQAQTLLEQARAALKRGRLTREDGSNNNALEHLTKLMFMLPNHAEGRDMLEQIIRRRHEATRKLLSRGELEQAGTYLGESERLIRKYNLSALRGAQATLDKNYRRAVDQASAPKPQEEPASAAQEATEQAEQVQQVQQQPVQQAQPARVQPPSPRPAAPRPPVQQNRPPQPRVVYTPAPAPVTSVGMEQLEPGETVLLPPPENSDDLTSREIIPLPVEPMPNETVLTQPAPMQEVIQIQQPPQVQTPDEMTLEQRVLQTRQQRQPQAQPRQARQQPEQQPTVQFQQPEPMIESVDTIQLAPVEPPPQLQQEQPVQRQQAQQVQPAPEEMTLEQRVLQARQAGRAVPQAAPDVPVMEYVPFVEGDPNAPVPNLEPVPFNDQIPVN